MGATAKLLVKIRSFGIVSFSSVAGIGRYRFPYKRQTTPRPNPEVICQTNDPAVYGQNDRRVDVCAVTVNIDFERERNRGRSTRHGGKTRSVHVRAYVISRGRVHMTRDANYRWRGAAFFFSRGKIGWPSEHVFAGRTTRKIAARAPVLFTIGTRAQ